MKPILFNTEMVKAILDGRKTVTRRVANINPEIACNYGEHEFILDNFTGGQATGFVCRKCGFGVSPPHSRYPVGTSVFRPRYRPGDILYVRETWGNYSYDNTESSATYFMYRADFPDNTTGYWYEPEHIHFCDFPRWRPSIHMPKEAARLFLWVKNVWVERLRDITTTGLQNEGIIPNGYISQYSCMTEFEYWFDRFKALWDSTIKHVDLEKYGWDANPWVWVIEFERCERPEEG